MPSASEPTCGLCGRAAVGLGRVSGFDLCEACRFDPASELAKLGIVLDRKVEKHRSQNSSSTTWIVTDRWTLPRSTEAVAAFAREDWVDRLMNRFRDELTVGDAVFDDAVRVRTDTVERTRALLDEGVQSAVLGLLVGSGYVKLDGPRVSTRRAGGSLADATPDQAETAALLLHLLRLTGVAR